MVRASLCSLIALGYVQRAKANRCVVPVVLTSCVSWQSHLKKGARRDALRPEDLEVRKSAVAYVSIEDLARGKKKIYSERVDCVPSEAWALLEEIRLLPGFDPPAEAGVMLSFEDAAEALRLAYMSFSTQDSERYVGKQSGVGGCREAWRGLEFYAANTFTYAPHHIHDMSMLPYGERGEASSLFLRGVAILTASGCICVSGASAQIHDGPQARSAPSGRSATAHGGAGRGREAR